MERRVNKSLFVLSKIKKFFYKENIVDPFVQASSGTKGYVVTNNDFLSYFGFCRRYWHATY